MSKDSGSGCSGWFKWLVGAVIALLAAGGGIVALLNYNDNQANLKKTAAALELNFAPPSNGVQNVTLRGSDRIDLESGMVSANPLPDRNWDLLFVCGSGGYEALRALDGVSWSEVGLADFNAIQYRTIRDASYQIRMNATTGYNDLYYAHKSNVPGQGYVFFFKTADGNVAKFQITGYETVDPNPQVCRNMTIQYEIFPVEGG